MEEERRYEDDASVKGGGEGARDDEADRNRRRKEFGAGLVENGRNSPTKEEKLEKWDSYFRKRRKIY